MFRLLALVGITMYFVFLFSFLYFFLTQEHKNRNTAKYQPEPMKDVISINSEVLEKTDAETSQPESRVFLIFLKASQMAKRFYRMCNFLRAFQEKNSPQSEFRVKSYARFMENRPK